MGCARLDRPMVRCLGVLRGRRCVAALSSEGSEKDATDGGPLRAAFVRTQCADPRLSFTVTVSLRDDPRLAVLLEKAKDGSVGDNSSDGVDGTAESDVDDYMADSYDGAVGRLMVHDLG